MASFQMWKETTVTLSAGLNVLNLDPTANIVKIINERLDGTALYLSTKPDVNQNKFEEKVEKGSSSSLVRTRALNTAYIFNPTANPITVTMIQIETDDISFIFNASNQVQISGVLTSDGLKATDLSLDGSRYLNTNVKSLPNVVHESFTPVKVASAGDTTIKTGGGKVAGIRVNGTITAIIKDGTTEVWKLTGAGHDAFSQPMSITGNIVINLSGAGEVYVLYK